MNGIVEFSFLEVLPYTLVKRSLLLPIVVFDRAIKIELKVRLGSTKDAVVSLSLVMQGMRGKSRPRCVHLGHLSGHRSCCSSTSPASDRLSLRLFR